MKDTVVVGDDGLRHGTFSSLGPSKAHKWPGNKLSELFKDVQSRYNVALQHYTKSGNHDPDFSKLSVAQVDVVYLWYWLQQYPDALSFVKGGFPDGLGVDSLDPDVSKMTPDGGRPANAMRQAAALRNKREGDALTVVATAISTLCSTFNSSSEADLQDMLDNVVQKIGQLQVTAQQVTGAAAVTDMTQTIEYYQERRRTLQQRMTEAATRGAPNTASASAARAGRAQSAGTAAAIDASKPGDERALTGSVNGW
eukprot:GHVU01007266.1.p1 GENE.GHVU01007266.1~~GHVU01007266.1.p1  ORF type:complete len:254 (+),score=46.55 GHVU01007266.1:174-935(+)